MTNPMATRQAAGLGSRPPMTTRGPHYQQRDDFIMTDAGPLDLTRQPEPGPGLLTLVEEASGDLTIAGKALVIPAQASPVWGDEGGYFGQVTRTAGRVMAAEINAGTWEEFGIGWHISAAVADPDDAEHALQLNTTDGRIDIQDGLQVWEGLSTSTDYQLAIVLRAAGAFYFGFDGTDWKLLYLTDTGATATLYPMFANLDGVLTMDSFRVAHGAWLPVPVASDSFDRANSSTLGNTDGAGHAEANGGDGLAWTEQDGDLGITSNKLKNAGAGGSQGFIGTVDCGLSDVVVEAKLVLVPSGESHGIVLRFSDANNFWYAHLRNGSDDIRILERVGGSWATRASASVTVDRVSTYQLIAVADAQTITAYVDGGNRITYGSATSNETATSHGIRNELANSTTDDFVVWRRDETGFPRV